MPSAPSGGGSASAAAEPDEPRGRSGTPEPEVPSSRSGPCGGYVSAADGPGLSDLRRSIRSTANQNVTAARRSLSRRVGGFDAGRGLSPRLTALGSSDIGGESSVSTVECHLGSIANEMLAGAEHTCSRAMPHAISMLPVATGIWARLTPLMA